MGSTLVILIVALLEIIVASSFPIFQNSVKAKIDFQRGMKLNLDASDRTSENKSSIRIKDAESSRGGLLAEDHRGGGVETIKVRMADGFISTSSKK